MKKAFILFLILSSVTVCSRAEEETSSATEPTLDFKKWELRLGYGAFSQWTSTFFDVQKNNFAGPSLYSQYNLNETFGIHAGVTWNNSTHMNPLLLTWGLAVKVPLAREKWNLAILLDSQYYSNDRYDFGGPISHGMPDFFDSLVPGVDLSYQFTPTISAGLQVYEPFVSNNSTNRAANVYVGFKF